MDFKSELSEQISYSCNMQESLHIFNSSCYFPIIPDEIVSYSLYVNAFIPDTGIFRWETTFNGLDSFCVIYTISGNCELKYDSFNYLLIANSIAFIDCRKKFILSRKKSQHWEAKLLFFNGLSVEQYYRRFYEKNICAFPLMQTSTLPSLFHSMETTLELPWDNNYTEYTLTKLLADIMMSIMLEKDSDPYTKQIYPNHIISALQFIEANFQTIFTLDELSHILNVSKSTLAHDFSYYVGETIIDSVIKRRIEYAKKQLVETNFPITKISTDSGFSSDSYFVHTFKKHTGLTPLQFRKQHNHYIFPHTIS